MNSKLVFGILCTAGLSLGLTHLTANGASDALRNRPVSPDTGITFPERADIMEASGGNEGGIAAPGPDVVLSDIQSVASYGPVGQIRAYSIGSHTCNIGTQSLLWVNNGTPALAMNLYRLHNGRLMQIGMSWGKHACCVANSNAPAICGMTCSAGGFGLRVGCLDVYTATWNAGQARLGPRSGINPYTGAFSPLSGTGANAVDRRLQVHESDLSTTNFPGALFFTEGVYVGSDDAAAGNWLNNASYRRVGFSGFTMNLPGGAAMHATLPAIYAWQAYGNGIGQPDNTVEIITVDHPTEGRYFVGSKVSDNGNGTWRYEYAVFNLNSDLSAGGFAVDLPNGVNVSNVGFHSPPYHSGEPYSNAFWTNSVGSGSVSWNSPQTFGQNPNTNALRWGTMYNYWFDADQPPTQGSGSLSMFKPTLTGTLTFTVPVPTEPVVPCPSDFDDSGSVDVLDLLFLLGEWGECKGCDADLDGSGTVDVLDLLILLGSWGPCPE